MINLDTMLCVTHEMGFARSVADRQIFMDSAGIVEMASLDELLLTRSIIGRRRFWAR
jgi:ABC-type polar amino acid transport system ATPase subunit